MPVLTYLGSLCTLHLCEPDGEPEGAGCLVPTEGPQVVFKFSVLGGDPSVPLPLTSRVILEALSKSLYPSPLFCHMVIMVPIGILEGFK